MKAVIARGSVHAPALRGLAALRRYASMLDTERMLPLRYLLVAGVIGVPGSIVQLTVMLWAYERLAGGYGTLALNVLWLLNFEIGLLRNFVLHCKYTWRMPPTWRRLHHAHVAAAGAAAIDLGAFNAVVITTGIIPLAQLFGASTGFFFNFGYNKLKTFASGARPPVVKEVTP